VIEPAPRPLTQPLDLSASTALRQRQAELTRRRRVANAVLGLLLLPASLLWIAGSAGLALRLFLALAFGGPS
jgi:hypothetical protein